MAQLTRIGTVQSEFKEPADPFLMRKRESTIEIDSEYREGLYRLEESAHVQVIFGFHLSRDFSLKGPVYSGEVKGVFASRSPRRPSPLGVTTVKLKKIQDGLLTVEGLDAVHGSPVYDIKPYTPVFDRDDRPAPETEEAYADPRLAMIRLLKQDDPAGCLLASGALHGHFCPGLSLGVYASTVALRRLREIHTDGMEDLMAVVEINNCFTDGVQAVTGCTLGNNALVYHDLGKTAVTLARRGKKDGARVAVRPGFHDLLAERYPEFTRLFDTVVRRRAGGEDDLAAFKTEGRKVAFGIINMPVEEIFACAVTAASLPPRATITASAVCAQCGEQMMETKSVSRGGSILCRTCAGESYPCVTGGGITQLD